MKKWVIVVASVAVAICLYIIFFGNTDNGQQNNENYKLSNVSLKDYMASFDVDATIDSQYTNDYSYTINDYKPVTEVDTGNYFDSGTILFTNRRSGVSTKTERDCTVVSSQTEDGAVTFTVKDLTSLKLTFYINQEYLDYTKTDDTIEFTYNSNKYRAVVSYIDPTLQKPSSDDTSSKPKLYIEANIEDVSHDMLVNGIAKIHFSFTQKSDVVSVPIDAVYYDDKNNPYIELQVDGKFVKTNVVLGASDVDYIEIVDPKLDTSQVVKEVTP